MIKQLLSEYLSTELQGDAMWLTLPHIFSCAEPFRKQELSEILI